jgi:hypothetical protein
MLPVEVKPEADVETWIEDEVPLTEPVSESTAVMV